MQSYSIRRFLTLNITAWVLTMTVIPAMWVYYDTSREVEELFDASLAQSSRVLHGMISRDTVEKHQEPMLEALLKKEIDPHVSQHNYEKKVSFQVIDETGIIIRSASAPDHPESGLKQGYTFHEVNGFEWRIFTLYSKEDKWWLVVGERMDIRDELIHDIALDHAIPLFLFTPFFIFIVNLVIRRGLKPLSVIADDVKGKDHASLDKLSYKKEPEEVSSLVSAINALFHSLSEQYDKEKRFSSDAAHELRTPLAALLVNTENLLESNRDTKLDGTIIKLKRSIHRLSHIVTQLLSLSRVDSDTVQLEFTQVNLVEIARHVLTESSTLAETKEQVLGIKVINAQSDVEDAKLELQGNAALLFNMLNNVTTNAIKYCPHGAIIDIKIDVNSKCIWVDDNGPGIPESMKNRVKDRFYRIPDSNNKIEGAGLGLAIVERIAYAHHISWLIKESELGGVSIEFQLP